MSIKRRINQFNCSAGTEGQAAMKNETDKVKMDPDRPGKLLSLLESLTDAQIETLTRYIGCGCRKALRADTECELVSNFGARLIEQIVHGFFPDVKRRQVYVEELVDTYTEDYNSNLFRRLGVTNKSELRRWLIRNHPDRGGNHEIYAEFLKEMQLLRRQ
jgi:hypothetical protein